MRTDSYFKSTYGMFCKVQACLALLHQLLSVERCKDKLTKKIKLTYLLKVVTQVILLTSHVEAAFAQTIEANFDGMTFVKIQAGQYTFGSPTEQILRSSNELALPVRVTHSFWLGKYEVSQAEWLSIMGYNPSTYQALAPSQDAPVENITWEQAQDFIARLNEQAGALYYRLPTETEWEYVAKAGQNTIWDFGDDLNVLSNYAYYAPTGPQGRGVNLANAWGIYDLYGNVYEWVEDWYTPFRHAGLGECPPANGQFKVIRGGSVNCDTRWLRASSRNFLAPHQSSYAVGLRLLRVDQPNADPYQPGQFCEPALVSIEQIPGLVIDEASNDLPEYNRDDWPHWDDDDGNCINTRHEVLVSESLTPVSMMDSDTCRVDQGLWADPYTGLNFTSAADLDVDHMVPLANAHLSGAWQWTMVQKKAYANDMSDAGHLIAVQAAANRSKGARGPEDWKPDNQDYHCDYAKIWISIKARWGLSATNLEWLALLEMLDTCPNGRPLITNAPEIDESILVQEPDHPGDVVNCSDFNHYDEALAWFMLYYNDYGDIANLDGDGDGIPCASLPGAP